MLFSRTALLWLRETTRVVYFPKMMESWLVFIHCYKYTQHNYRGKKRTENKLQATSNYKSSAVTSAQLGSTISSLFFSCVAFLVVEKLSAIVYDFHQAKIFLRMFCILDQSNLLFVVCLQIGNNGQLWVILIDFSVALSISSGQVKLGFHFLILALNFVTRKLFCRKQMICLAQSAVHVKLAMVPNLYPLFNPQLEARCL